MTYKAFTQYASSASWRKSDTYELRIFERPHLFARRQIGFLPSAVKGSSRMYQQHGKQHQASVFQATSHNYWLLSSLEASKAPTLLTVTHTSLET